ncbi:hypothetical protein RND81_13G119300 [Saponaria officinalis]|uniref:No apical meristem-associated C-terminal domain-containing protein n=1 Tax=Saponaria officinalis TaxID=3572 RepID=A0AAW1GWQ4_SAPOF
MDPNSNNFQNNSNNNNNFEINHDEWRKQMWIEFQRMNSQLSLQLSQNISRNESVTPQSQWAQIFFSTQQSSPNFLPSSYPSKNYDHRQFSSQNLQSRPQNLRANMQNITPIQENYPLFSSQVECTEHIANDVDNEDGDDDVVETPSLGVQPSNKRVMNKNHFSLAEDEALISSFMQHSQDPTIGTNQKKRDLWVKVKNLLDEARKANPSQIRERSAGMLGSRWRRIAAGVMKWVGCYEEAARRKTSGMSEEDVIKEAIKTHNGPFQFEHQWILLKKFRKWESCVGGYLSENCRSNYNNVSENIGNKPVTPTSQTDPESQGSGKRSRNNITSDDGEGSISKRHMGVKAAKMNKGKGKGNVVQMEFLAETIKGYSEVQIQRMEMTKQKEARKQKQIEIELRKLELDEKRQQDGERAMKWSVLQTLLQRSDLNPQEEELKMTLLKDLSVI